ncbi:hypothetical protein KC353_g9964 [Hortaea werneckii]|nr:hypothetical protein KC353_g9964 [Hortaea werneckii]
MPQRLNSHIREYFTDAAKTVSKSAWASRPEITTSAETGGNSSTSDIIEIVPNKRHGAWESKEAYLGAPTSAEVLDVEGRGSSPSTSDIIEIVPNKRHGAWESKEAYLGAPTSAEVLNQEGSNSSSTSDIIESVPNKRYSAWESKEAYLGAHYELLREEAVKPLRE